ncbi:hypothetical protein I7I53_08623 [Histoplasma capsulatum var. duboisii H88]|uniref:Uncharacterized protein n=1 Tax=Ajellomyces capsulatus (strain H88) TaxID=544711 RepID=A0A8A1LLZ5_AJEC8|nr:hypothetical protein I7I53_08623 [Histoplasma capsulatum var. duboisii H88]
MMGGEGYLDMYCTDRSVYIDWLVSFDGAIKSDTGFIYIYIYRSLSPAQLIHQLFPSHFFWRD